MGDYAESVLGRKFLEALEKETDAKAWWIQPLGDTDFEKGCRAGIEIVLATIREQHSGMGIWKQEDGTFTVALAVTETLEFADDLERIILSDREYNKGDDEAIRAFSGFLRRMADEVDKALSCGSE